MQYTKNEIWTDAMNMVNEMACGNLHVVSIINPNVFRDGGWDSEKYNDPSTPSIISEADKDALANELSEEIEDAIIIAGDEVIED